MHAQLPDSDLSLTLTWIWLACIGFGVLALVVYRLWRKRHPPVKADTSSYARKLTQRLRQGKARAGSIHRD